METPKLSLLQFLRDSFDAYLQPTKASDNNSWSDNTYEEKGLNAIFKSVFPLVTRDQLCSLEYVTYHIAPPKFDADECLKNQMTLAAPLKVTVRLVICEEDSGQRMIRDIKEQELYFGEIPLLTERGTFIFNGEERYIPPSLQKAPGVSFSRNKEGEPTAFLTSWYGLQLELTKRKSDYRLRLTIPDELLTSYVFHRTTRTILLSPNENELYLAFEEVRPGRTALLDLKAPSGEVIIPKKQRITAAALKKLRNTGSPGVQLSAQEKIFLFSAEDVFYGGELILGKNQSVLGAMSALQQKGIFSIRAYLMTDEPSPKLEVLLPSEADILHWFETSLREFDLSVVGRLRLNQKLSLTTETSHTFLQRDELSQIIQRLSNPKEDNPNHLGELQLISVGERMAQASWFGLLHVEKTTMERLERHPERDTLMPHDLFNSKPHSSAMRQLLEKLSLPLDTKNPLALLSQLRQIQVPQGFEAHPTHQDRISHEALALYAKPNDYLFIDAPYLALQRKKTEVQSLSAYETEHLLQNGIDISDVGPPHKKGISRVSPLQRYSLAEALNLEAPHVYLRALPLYHAEPVPVEPSLCALIARESKHWIEASDNEEVFAIGEDRIITLSANPESFLPSEYLLRGLTPLVKEGQALKAGDLLAQDITTKSGLSLGRSVKVSGDHHEVAASTKMKQTFTSRHVHRLEFVLSYTNEGNEFLQAQTEDPRLDAAGVIREGELVRAGDVLVKKMLQTNGGVVDASLSAPEGCNGKVTRVDVLVRAGSEDPRREQQDSIWSQRIETKRAALSRAYQRRIIAIAEGQTLAANLCDQQGQLLQKKGEALTADTLRQFGERLGGIELQDQTCQEKLERAERQFEDDGYRISAQMSPSDLRVELPPGVVALIQITIEQERPLGIGDTLMDTAGHVYTIATFFDAEEEILRLPGEAKGQRYLCKTALAEASA
jgi:DNA-directed RNA polymerase subunit beta